MATHKHRAGVALRCRPDYPPPPPIPEFSQALRGVHSQHINLSDPTTVLSRGGWYIVQRSRTLIPFEQKSKLILPPCPPPPTPRAICEHFLIFTRKIEEAIAMQACALNTDAYSTDFLQVKINTSILMTQREKKDNSYHKGRINLPPIRSNFFVKKRSFFFI